MERTEEAVSGAVDVPGDHVMTPGRPHRDQVTLQGVDRERDTHLSHVTLHHHAKVTCHLSSEVPGPGPGRYDVHVPRHPLPSDQL